MGQSAGDTLSMYMFLTLAFATTLSLASPESLVQAPLTYSPYHMVGGPIPLLPSVRTMYHDCDDSLHDCDDRIETPLSMTVMTVLPSILTWFPMWSPRLWPFIT